MRVSKGRDLRQIKAAPARSAQTGAMQESLDHHDIALVQHSLAILRRDLPPGDTRFYDRLFRRNPEMRPMFRDDIAGQGMRFVTTLGLITDALTAPAVFDREITRLAEGHAAIGVSARQFAPMGDALLDTFHDVLGPRFTPETRAAWERAFALIAAEMIARGDIAR